MVPVGKVGVVAVGKVAVVAWVVVVVRCRWDVGIRFIATDTGMPAQ